MTDGLVAVLGRGIVDSGEPVIVADDLGFARGDGCFETCRVVTDGNGASSVHNLPAHMARLRGSLAQLDISVDVQACEDLIEQAVVAWSRPGEASARLVVSRGPDGAAHPTVVVSVHPVSQSSLSQREAGVRVITLPRGTTSWAYDDAGWLLGGVKTISYAVNMAALRHVAAQGADDAIWISSDGAVLEAPTATVIWRNGDRLLTTPTGGSGILPGTTLGALFAAADDAGLETGTASLDADALAAVDGLWLASSVRGVVEVVELNGRPRPSRRAQTEQLQKLAGF